MKSLLFVCYGGGHVNMVAPLFESLKKNTNYELQLLALTTAPARLDQLQIPYKRLKDFIDIDLFTLAKAHGEQLASSMHNQSIGIDYRESITYLGVSYKQLVDDLGREGAEKIFLEKGRHSFLPLDAMRTVFDSVDPDMVITTSSPRAEKAAVLIAKERGIPSLSMLDMFGDNVKYQLCADYITVFSSVAKDNLIKAGVNPSSIYITGNPAFDSIARYTGAIDWHWRRSRFGDKKIFLWADKRSYLNRSSETYHERSNKEMLRDLDALVSVCKKNNVLFLLRPHPSQELDSLKRWVKGCDQGDVELALDYPLHQLLNAVDFVGSFNSTVLVEAILIGRPVFQIDYTPPPPVLPLESLTQRLWISRSSEDIEGCVQKMLDDCSSGNVVTKAGCHSNEVAGINFVFNGVENVVSLINEALEGK